MDWARILSEHQGWLRQVLYARLGGTRDEVDEVMQEVALAAVGQQPSLSDPRKAQAWLYHVAVKQALMFRRAAGRRRKLNAAAARQPPPQDSIDPLAWLLASEQREQVREALRGLAPRDQEILLLKHGENMSYREIAETIGLSVSAVEARLHRARKKLRARLSSGAIRD